MLSAIRLATALVVYMTAQSALAGDGPEAGLSWRLAFGAGAIETGYGVSLSYADRDLGDARAELLSLDVSDRAAFARLAGVPLLQRDYVVSQDDAAPRPEFRVALSQPWYAKSWVWWTAGGLAATAALASAGSSSGESDEDDGPTGRGGVACGGGNVGDVELESDECVVPCPGPGDNSCVGNALVARPNPYATREPAVEWLDAHTGWMGDLIER